EELPESLSGGSSVTTTKVLSVEKQVVESTQMSSLMLEKAIAKQIKPLRKEIQALKEKSGFRDIIGGIGYIFGLLGLVAFLRDAKLKAKN
ncbi:MAG: hypothetical protein GY787_08975, partial [Alteromonadales bacterium]|nr:hypothetical protein [Alteromonadales bacterium]